MSQPAVTITQLDGALGVLPPSSGKLLAVVGVSSTGPQDTPATYARAVDVAADFGIGPMVEAACHYIEQYGKAVVVVRTGETTAGDPGTLDVTGYTGTATPTLGAVEPRDDFDLYLKFITGGTVGTAGITYQYSLDGGRTMSPTQDLGTAMTITWPDTGGVDVTFAAGDITAGDVLSTRTKAPLWAATDLGTSLDALAASVVNWGIVEIVGDLDATGFDAIETKFASLVSAGKYRTWFGHFRMPNLSETEAAYLTAFTTAFGAKSTIYGAVSAGAVKLISSVSGRDYRRPVSFIAAAREASVDEDVNTADVNLGPFTGVSIRDSNGNPDEHDESVNPGLDDARAYVLRTWDGIQGVYVNRPQLLSPSGSDFQLVPHRRVMNIAAEILRAYFIRRLSAPVLVDSSTGYILEHEAQEIEAGALAELASALLAKPKASDVQFSLSRTDNVLSTKTLTGQARVIPLGYPETISLDLGFLNPALQVQTAA